jgi:hypothetical protein
VPRAAFSRSAAEVTTLMRIVDVEIIAMLTSRSASVRNILAAMPGLDFMPAPTRLIFAISLSCSTPRAPISEAIRPTIDCAVAMSAFGIVKLMSVVPSWLVFCTIMSTFTLAAASGSNRAAEMPGRSGTATIVTLLSDRSVTTPEMIGSSMLDSCSSVTHVPCSQVKLERTWSGTLWLRANSTLRSASTLLPAPAISSISSKLIRCSLRACGTMRGSAVKTPVTSV